MDNVASFQPKPTVIPVDLAQMADNMFMGGLVRILIARGVLDAGDILDLLEDIEQGVADYMPPGGPATQEQLDAVRALGRRWRRAVTI